MLLIMYGFCNKGQHERIIFPLGFYQCLFVIAGQQLFEHRGKILPNHTRVCGLGEWNLFFNCTSNVPIQLRGGKPQPMRDLKRMATLSPEDKELLMPSGELLGTVSFRI